MKICNICAVEYDDNAKFCKVCGGGLQAHTAVAEPPHGVGHQVPVPDASLRNQNKISQGGRREPFFISPDEVTLASLGASYRKQGSFRTSRGAGFITNKRFYYSGTDFFQSSKGVLNANQEGVIDLEDITFCRYIYTRNIRILICAFIINIISLICAMGEIFELFVFGLILASFFYLGYFLSKSIYYMVSFPGGEFTFKSEWYPMEEIQQFQKTLFLAKEKLK